MKGREMDELKDYWGLILAAIGAGVWLVRLEAGVKKSQSDIRALWKQRNEDLEASKQSRAETNQVLQRLEEKMDNAWRELREDIKELLRQGGK